MSKFTRFTGIQPVPKTRKWKTTADLTWYRYYDDTTDSGIEPITVPKGFESDGVSVPVRVLIMPVMGYVFQRVDPRTILAGIVHDRLYKNTDKHSYTRLECDEIFCEILIVCGMDKAQALTMKMGVNALGRMHYG